MEAGKTDTMNERRQNEKIALYCGWKFDKNQYKQWISPDGTSWNYPPAYNKDLNQMHEAEKSLKGNTQWYKYEEILEAIVRAETAHWPIHATAAQRAEAFLKTIGKWEE